MGARADLIDAVMGAQRETRPGSPHLYTFGLDRDGVIADETWGVLVEHLDARQILDIIFTAGAYATIAWMVQSLGIELDDDLREGLAG